jgi:hypothetical protein
MLLSNGSANMFQRQQMHARVEEMLDALFSVRPVAYLRKTGEKFFPELLFT